VRAIVNFRKCLLLPVINRAIQPLIIPLFVLFSPGPSTADTLSYYFSMDKDTAFSSCIISKVEKGTIIKSDWRAETLFVQNELMLDTSGVERAWKSCNVREGTQVSAVRSGDSLLLTGTYRKKPVTKSYALKGIAWKQMIPFDLADFAFSKNASLTFLSIALMGPYALKTAQMQAKRVGEETISYKGETTAAIHIRVSPAGIFAALWHANYWFRKNDGVFIRSESTGMPGRPGAIMELTREK
jgi:hypothetical protein